MKPLVSVVIPLYNKESTVANAIDSVLAQTVADFELIVVNDGSKDKGVSIVQQYHDDRLRLIEQENQGVSVARNRGIAEAKSELVAFLDADDMWYPDFLKTILSLRRDYPLAGMYGTAYAVFSEDVEKRENAWTPELGSRMLDSYYLDVVKSGYPIIITSSFAAPKKVLESVGGYVTDFRSGQDHDLFSRIAFLYDVAYSPEICVRYNAGAENNMNRVTYLLETPLESYINTLSSEELAMCRHPDDLSVHLDFWRLKTGARNIYSGFRTEGRRQLRMVTHPQFQWKKRLFLFLSYLPISLSNLSPKLVRTVTHKLRLSA